MYAARPSDSLHSFDRAYYATRKVAYAYEPNVRSKDDYAVDRHVLVRLSEHIAGNAAAT